MRNKKQNGEEPGRSGLSLREKKIQKPVGRDAKFLLHMEILTFRISTGLSSPPRNNPGT